MALSQKKPERDAQLLADAKNGQTPAQLAIKYKISVGAVSVPLNEWGFRAWATEKKTASWALSPNETLK